MSKGTKEARARRAARRRERREAKNLSVAEAWEKVKSRPGPEKALLDHFREKKGYHKYHKPLEDQELELATLVSERAPKIADRREALWYLANTPWLRPLGEWKPEGKAAETQFRSLVNHLIVKYPMPPFLFQVFTGERGRFNRVTLVENHVWFFFRVAQGESPHKLITSPFSQNGTLGVPLTKRMTHLFMQAPAKMTLVEAARRAQVEVFGGDHRLCRTILGTRLGQRLMPNEGFWMTVIQWFCNHSMVDPVQVGPLIDYIFYLRGEDADFSMKGRSPLALMRGMERWHNALAHIKKLKGKEFEPSGFVPGEWVKKRRMGNGNFITDIWTMKEILTSKDLAKEGREMKHCVYSYGRSIESGRVSIWSLQQNEERCLTVEVVNQQRAVTQARGRLNRKPTPTEAAYLQRWADRNELAVGRYVL